MTDARRSPHARASSRHPVPGSKVRMAMRSSVWLLLSLFVGACSPIADYVDRRLNPVTSSSSQPVSEEHRALHRRMFVVDLHADTLMWNRDLLVRGQWGHVDVPRLLEGGVNLQVFTVVTKTPPERHTRSSPDRHCVEADGINMTGALSVVQGRSPGTWFDLRERALYQARRLRDAVERSEREGPALLVLIRTDEDLQRVIRSTRGGGTARPTVGVILGLEGANWLQGTEDDVRADVRRLFDEGFRTFALTHRYDNTLAGSSEGCEAGPLTKLGLAALKEAERLGMTVDLAHLSSRALDIALPQLAFPPIVSHTGIVAGCETPCYGPRNLSDHQLRQIARLGGVIGIGFWPEAIGTGGERAIVDAFSRAARALSGTDFALPPIVEAWRHLAFGSDFDGAVEAPFDVTGMPGLTFALRQGTSRSPGLSPEALAAVAGANAVRVLSANLRRVATSQNRSM